MSNKSIPLPNWDILNNNLCYDETSPSCIRWKIDRPGQIKKNDIAGHLKNNYYIIKIKSQKYFLHRIVWKLINKEEPTDVIDHIDGDSTNNKISNLRSATRRQNSLNIKIPKDNSSGAIGVYWIKSKKKWKVEIRSFGKSYYFGTYSSLLEAKNVAEINRIKLHGNWIRM